MGKTSIEWTDCSWNPVVGCSRVSPGCQHCYAERLAGTRLRETAAYKGLTKGRYDEMDAKWTGEIRLLPDRLDEPLRWRKPRRIFVCDMGDLFHEAVPDEYIDRVFAVMALASRHTFQVLTKRAERMKEYVTTASESDDVTLEAHELVGQDFDFFRSKRIEMPLPNVWLGVSVEDQKRLDDRVPLLLQTPAAIRFLSVEPMLEAVSLAGAMRCDSCGYTRADQGTHADHHLCERGRINRSPIGIDWVIFGGESGPGARSCNVEWIRDGLRQCREAGVAAFVKQDSGPRPGMQGRIPDDLWNVKEFPDAIQRS